METRARDLAQAELNLRYCDIFSEIDGVVTSRTVNPGDYVQVGQSLTPASPAPASVSRFPACAGRSFFR